MTINEWAPYTAQTESTLQRQSIHSKLALVITTELTVSCQGSQHCEEVTMGTEFSKSVYTQSTQYTNRVYIHKEYTEYTHREYTQSIHIDYTIHIIHTQCTCCPSCLQVGQPNLPLYCIMFVRPALAGKSARVNSSLALQTISSPFTFTFTP